MSIVTLPHLRRLTTIIPSADCRVQAATNAGEVVGNLLHNKQGHSRLCVNPRRFQAYLPDVPGPVTNSFRVRDAIVTRIDVRSLVMGMAGA